MTMIRELERRDEARWRELFDGYRTFYGNPHSREAIDTTWQWVTEKLHGLECLVAVDDTDQPIAFAHLRVFARPSVAELGIYLDDLFTDPAARGTGAGTALLREIASLAHARGASLVRWITDRDNATARRVYDANATETRWVTYDMPPRG